MVKNRKKITITHCGDKLSYIAVNFIAGFMHQTHLFLCFFFSQPKGADFSDHNKLGSGVAHPGPGAGQSDVQPAEEAVRRHRGTGAGHEEILHHQRRIRAGCY